MLGRLGVIAAALVLAPAAFAAYPTPYASQGDPGVFSADGTFRFVAKGAGTMTLVTMLKASDGSRLKSTNVAGSFGIPMLTYNGLAGGLSYDGKMLVLQSMGLPPMTRFVVVGTDDLGVRARIKLSGLFGYDALSPDGSKLYLIERRSSDDLDEYVVRAYDLKKHKLLPGRIADRAQKSWVMRGRATTRTTSSDGRWVYTLYANPGGYPFIHALDTVKAVAHCIGVPWPATDATHVAVNNLVLSLHDRTLSLDWNTGSSYLTVDTKTWRVKKTGTVRE
jgi:hypothetical protein